MIGNTSKKLWPKINYTKLIKKRLPITTWLFRYTLSTFLQDLLAGLTVGMTEIPQGLAYAAVAGLPPEYGLYSGLLDGFVYAVFGGCKDLNIGPSSLLSLLVQPSVLIAGPQAAVLLTFLSGVIILVLGVLNLGFIINFFSHPVTSGFICAGCFHIGFGQFVKILGIPGKSDTFLNSFVSIVNHIHETRMWNAILGISSILVLIFLKTIGRFGSVETNPAFSKPKNFFRKFIFLVSIGRSALVLILGTSLAYILRDSSPFVTTGHISAGFPSFQAPLFSTIFNGTEYSFEKLISTFGLNLPFVPLISILEAFTIAKMFDKAQRLDGTQEMLALGLCNFLGAFVGSMPVTGSFSRSGVNNASGVKTTMAGVFTSLLLLLAIAFLTSTFYYVPKATLAAILIGAIIYLFDYKTPILLWKTKKLDLIPFFTTFFIGLFVGNDYGIFIGALVNVTFVLYGNARPKLYITKEKSGESDICTVTPNHTLYFPAAEYLRDSVLKCKCQGGTVVINGKYIRSMDITVAKTFATLIQELKMKNCTVFLLDFKNSVVKVCIGVDKTLSHCFFSEEAFNNIEEAV